MARGAELERKILGVSVCAFTFIGNFAMITLL